MTPATEALCSYGESAQACLTKSLLVRCRHEARLVIVVAASCEKVDFHKVARSVGSKKAGLASLAELLAFVGYGRGSVSPLVDTSLPVVCDRRLLTYDTVLVNSGREGGYVAVELQEFRTLTHALVTEITLPRSRWE